ncbi:MAG: alpha/beta fold hydrolase, partial [Candidatus Binatia bacterium]
LDTFAGAGFHAIAPDALGYGRSSKPEGATFDGSFLVAGLRQFLDALGIEKAAFVGNAMGASMAIQLAAESPERVERLVVMAPGGIGDIARYLAMPVIQIMLRVAHAPEGPTRQNLRELFEALVLDRSIVTDELVEERYEAAVAQPKRVLATLRFEDLAPRLPELRMPLLALWGRDDGACPLDAGLDIVRACDTARLVVFAKCGHWVHAERATIFNEMCVSFLKEVSR